MKIGNLEVYGIIYKITNKINNKVYIGQTINKRGFDGRYGNSGNGIEKVYKHYKYCKEQNTYYNEYLLKSIEKYGVSNFKVDKLFDIAFSKEELDIKEYIWINYFDCVNNGYNWEEGGSHGKPSNETKAKISKILKQKYNNGEMIAPMKGKHHSKEAKLKIGKYNKGKVLSKETKIKISETHKGENSYLFGKTGKLHNSYGKTHSDMAKIKMKENHANFKRGNHPLSKKIICITTGRLFECIVDGAEYYNIKAKSHITSCCQGKRHYCGKLLDGTPLKWMYYDDYIKQQSIHNKNLEQAI